MQGTAPVEAEAGPGGTVLNLDEGVWLLRAAATGYWSQAVEVVVGSGATGTRLALWPAASLRGEVATTGDDSPPAEIVVELRAVDGRGPARAELRCRVEAGAWSCIGPAGVFDVRLQAAAYAPHHAWDADLPHGAVLDLGRTVLGRTSSVLGRALRSDGSSPPSTCVASVQGDGTRRGAADGEASRAVTLSRRGFFQILGVAPGEHVLSVDCDGASAARELRVRADAESRVEPPLLLEELALDVVVTPKADAQGRPWLLSVEATSPHWRRIAGRAQVSADGRWTRRGLTAGAYRISLESADGTPRLQRVVELGPGSGTLSLRAHSIDVAGRVLLSGQPLRARLAFSDEAGGEPVVLQSDDDGRFEGQLPAEPGARDTRWSVEVRATRLPVLRRLEGVAASAWLELALPVFAVRGSVVSEDGEPRSGAEVVFEAADGDAPTATATDDAGRFELAELPPGRYTARAESAEGQSEPATLDVVEGVESELRLVLKRSESAAFFVVSSQGPVADAAVQVSVAPGVPRGVLRSDTDGRFETALPPGTTEVGLTIAAPGHALKLSRLPVAGDRTVMLVAAGGTLVLDLQLRPEDGALTPYLVHDGAVEAAGALADASDGTRIVIEAIEPGVYALCLADPAQLAALWRGSLPAGRCRTGSLEPGRSLTLAPR